MPGSWLGIPQRRAKAMRVLIIEDDDEIASYLVTGLAEEGYSATRAADGETAWHYLKTETWDAVLLDWWLPDTDGLNLLRRFRQSNATTPVLFLTSRDEIANRVKGLDAGANDYLCKPFAFAELLARIRVVTRVPDRSAGSVLCFGDIKLDMATQRAERGGQRLELTAKELALLVLFMRHPGEVLSRTRIYESVWDDRYDGLSNTLDVHVKHLRQKLETNGPRLIHTLRHRGYFFGDSNQVTE
jgi:two-component system copper resistance phosphate regulon response regulator CusR